MTILCITGADNSILAPIADAFYRAGMQRPKSLQRESEIDFSRWHSQVAHKLAQRQPIGRLWEGIASDLLLTNLESECWGWYEHQSVDALDFWAELEPNIHFLLVCTRPDQYLQRTLQDTASEVDAQKSMQKWYERHTRMLQFYLKHPERTLLIDAHDALRHLGNQLALAHERWQLPINTEAKHEEHALEVLPVDSADSVDAPQGIVSILTREVINNSSLDITGFYAELKAAQYPLNQQDGADAFVDFLSNVASSSGLQSIFSEYQHLQHQANSAKQVPVLENQNKQAQAKLEESKQENELLLLQLHQVQEELEHYFLQHKDVSKQAQDLKEETRRLKHQRQMAQQQVEEPRGWLARLGRKKRKNEPQLHYEGVHLRHEQVNPDYEHLWISLKDPSFGESCADQWHFRLSCAGVKPDAFGQQPKLELPEQSPQLLQHWFAESESDLGSKLELRFALPGSMDTGVWKQIHPDDQKFIKNLLQELPSMLEDLSNHGTEISRAWDDWNKLAHDMLNIHKTKLK